MPDASSHPLFIYLSPHLDDAVFSAGGLIRQQTRKGSRVEIWSICAADAPPGELPPFARSLHDRWQAGEQPVAARRREDLLACERVGASPTHFSLPDCIYRRTADGAPLVQTEQDLFQPLPPSELALAQSLAGEITAKLPQGAVLVCPLGLGGHIDHRLVRRAAELTGRPLLFYADFPYALRQPPDLAGLGSAFSAALTTEDLRAWQEGIAAYPSQISSFWPSLEAMRAVVAAYAAEGGGSNLWNTSG